MSLKKFMHPRNKYKIEPDFKSLAVIDPDFRKIAITQLNGTVKINFKDKNSLIILTKTLLKHDFNLNVNIPEMKLVPALPLRLNYILWIEDLINFGHLATQSEIHGIDIGVGAICIYPLLIAQQYKWKMTGSEIDPTSLKFSNENIKNNNLEHLIKVKLVSSDTILKEVVQDENFTFVMCNPPFFKTDDLARLKKNPPRNASTGCERELIVEGGEQKFISRLIDDSMEIKNRIKIYSTMFGKKNTLAFVKRELSNRNITNATWTEFCQGYTKRWGLAWSFLPEEIINLKNAPVIRAKTEVLKKHKESACMIEFSKTNQLCSIEDLNNCFNNCIKELNLKIKQIDLEDDNEELNQCYIYQLTAYEDNWSHARRKRRMAIRNESVSKKQCVEKCEDYYNLSKLESSSNQELENTETINTAQFIEPQQKVPYLKCNVLIQETENIEETQEEKKDQLKVCFIFEDGSGGKQALETLRQYFINQFNIREYLQTNSDKKSKKKKKKNSKNFENNSVITI